MQKKNIIRIVLVTVLILLVPLVAMQFTDEVGWGIGDFIVMGILLFGTGFIIDFVTRKLTNTAHRSLAVTAIVIAFLLVWAELAVGVFGTPWAGF